MSDRTRPYPDMSRSQPEIKKPSSQILGRRLYSSRYHPISSHEVMHSLPDTGYTASDILLL